MYANFVVGNDPKFIASVGDTTDTKATICMTEANIATVKKDSSAGNPILKETELTQRSNILHSQNNFMDDFYLTNSSNIFCFQGSQFIVYKGTELEKNYKRCDQKFRLEEYRNVKDLTKCKYHCENDPSCKFFFYSVENFCDLFTSCAQLATNAEKSHGIIFEKLSKGILLSAPKSS